MISLVFLELSPLFKPKLQNLERIYKFLINQIYSNLFKKYLIQMIKLWGEFGCRLICWLFFGTWKTRTVPAWRLFGGHSKQKIVIILLSQKTARTRSIRNCIRIPTNPCHSMTPLQSFSRFVCCLNSYFQPWVQLVGLGLIQLPWLLPFWDWKQVFPRFCHFCR